MTAQDKLVYISYRQADLPKALVVSQKISVDGFNACIDHGENGDKNAEKVNFQQIKIRPHFILILTPSALKDCDDPTDPMRREVEAAFDHRNLILTLLCDGASFDDPHFKEQLSGPFLRLLDHKYVTAPKGRLAQALPILCSELRMAVPAAYNRMIINALTDVEVDETGAEDVPPATVAAPALTAREWFERGDQADDAEEKIRCFSEAIRMNPGSAVAYNNRGKAYADKGYVDLAINDLSTAIRLLPDYATAYSNRGSALTTKGDYEAAIADCIRAIHLDPNMADAYNNLGAAYHRKGDTDRAIECYTRAIKIDPTLHKAYANRGNALHDKHDLQNGYLDCTEAIRLQPDFAGSYLNRGSIRFDLGDLDGALEDCTQAIKLDPKTIEHYKSRAAVFIKKGNFTSALSDVQQCRNLEQGMQDGELDKLESLIVSLQNSG